MIIFKLFSNPIIVLSTIILYLVLFAFLIKMSSLENKKFWFICLAIYSFLIYLIFFIFFFKYLKN